MPPSPPHKASSIASSILQKCAATTSLREARRLHALLLTTPTATESPLYIQNNILSMYARCGCFTDSHRLFDKIPHRSIVSYNTLIAAYSRSPHHAHLAFHLFDQLAHENHVPNQSTITSLLQASAALSDLALGSLIHAHCVKTGFLDNVHVQTSLLGMYSKCNDVDCTKRVFSQMKDKDAIAWNTVISGYIKNGKLFESLELFRSMLYDESKPTNFTYSLVLNACAKLQDYDTGKVVHAQVLRSGTWIDLPLHNSLLDMYCTCRDTSSAYDVFLRIRNPDLVSWNSMIGGFAENGDGKKAVEMFIQLKKSSHLKPDEYTYAAVIAPTYGYCGKALHAQTEKIGLTRSGYIASTLLTMYFSSEDLSSSKNLFNSFVYKDAILWTDMISGHVRVGESEAALTLFYEMCKEGLHLDSFILSSVLAACADLVTLRQGEMIHSLVLKTGNNDEVWVKSSLVDMYAKNGELEAARYTFSCMTISDLKCWNSMLTGYGHHGKAKEAFQIYFAMLKHGLSPDSVTFLSLLAACNHCGLVEESRFFWKDMKERGLRPGSKHYSCMISLLSRGGMWEEAEEVIIESPFADDYLESWRTILSSCIENGNVREGIYAAEQILNTDSEDSAANVLLTKLYAAAGRWGGVVEMRRKMRAFTKDPGLSWIEVRNCVCVFASGEQSHELYGEVQAEMSHLVANLMPTIPDVDLSMH